MTGILFICTGNIFRSVTAEYALLAALGDRTDISVASAGTLHAPGYTVRPDVAAYLQRKELDVSGHRRRTLTSEMLEQTDVVIAMSVDHQSILEVDFQTDAMLFTEACGGSAEALLDVDDLFAPDDRHSPAARQHIYGIIDQIVNQTPALAGRLTSGWRPNS